MIPQTSHFRVDYNQSVKDFLTQCDVYIERKEISKALSILSRLSLFQFQNNQIQSAIDTSKRAQLLALDYKYIKEASFLCLQEADFHIGLFAYPYCLGKYIDALYLTKKISDSDSEFRITQRFVDLYNNHSAVHGLVCSSFATIEVSYYVSNVHFFQIFSNLIVTLAKKLLDKGMYKQSTELYSLIPIVIRHFEHSLTSLNDDSFQQNLQTKNEIDTSHNDKLEKIEREYNSVRDSLERKNAFLRASIHDLTNPVQNIRMFSELLQQLLPEIQNSDIEELTETLQKSTVDVLHILSQMSIYSTVERNAYDTNAVEVRFPLLIQNEVNKLKEKFQQKKITLRFMQEVPDISFKTYVKSLGFIFSEMLQNAWKFSPIHSLIAINIQSKALSNQQLLIRISVRDQGAGIKQEESHKIGVPFTKLSSKPTNNEPSAGLGLSISTLLAQQLQGKLHFDFRQQIGCTVHFDFTVSI
ncbi:MAG: HAMP domain-containing histidine kinase [Candidatus Kapabacteria bacterium]|nr:HAMP domain-containing histidine kinase [Candidatus Kapabacteria bacterium]